MKRLRWILAFAVLFIALPAAGEFYKYVDENGNTRFTDDINQVPADQRDRVRSYVESESKPVEETAAEASDESAPPEAKVNDVAATSDQTESAEGDFEKTRRELDDMKKELDDEFAAILAEKDQLSKEREQAKTREQIQAYNKKVESLNARAEAYENKSTEFGKRVDAFNARIMEQNAKNN